MARRDTAVAVVMVAITLAIAHSASAQAQREQPPVIRFDPGGIGLEEAVALTLQNAVIVKLQDADLQRSTGAAQEARGQFDASLFTRADYSYRVQELTENRKENERRKRETIREELERNRTNRGNAQALVDQLLRVQSAPPGSSQVTELTRLSPTLGAQVQMLDALIAAATGQQRTDLLNVRNQLLTNSIETSRENLQGIISDYDQAQLDLEHLGEAPIDEVFYRGGLRVEFAKLFRTGITLTPFFDGSLDGTNFKGKPRAEEFGGKGIEDLFSFHVGTDFLVPLMRGRGSVAVTTRERATALEVEASQFSVDHNRAVSALGTINAYWDLRGFQEALEVANRSVALNTRIVELTRNLIQAGDLPAIELSRAEAGLARARARVEELQRSIHEARVELATVMGVATTGEDATLPTARETFPTVDAEPGMQVGALVERAPDDRRDVSAAVKSQEAADVVRRGAETNLRPRLDLFTGIFWTALAERTISNAIDRWVGPSANATLDYEKPIGNNRYRGQLVQADASARTQAIAAADLRRQARLGVVRAASSLPDALGRLRNAQDAVRFSQAIVDAELQRFQQNESTLLDTIITEQQSSEAALILIIARQDLAQLIAEFRFETGTLVTDGPIQRQNLVTPPAAPGR